MKDWITWAIVLGVMLLVVGVPFALRPAERVVATAPSDRLVIITPHNEQIRFELSQGFNRYRKAMNKTPVAFDWRSSGGTSDLRKQVLSELTLAAEKGREDSGIGYDLFFGGGDFDHNLLARGITVTNRGDKPVSIPAIVSADLPEALMKEAFPEPTIGGVPLYHPKKAWVGAVLSSFGILYNRDVLAARGVPEPKTWVDLTDPKLRQGVALADPAHSGSIGAVYNVILRRNGWTDGWALLRRAFANGRYFTSSASKVPVDVSAGEAAAGLCIDFYGRFQAGAISSGAARGSDGSGANRLGYVDPQFVTTVNPDPIALVRGAPHREIAVEFIAWVLSREAQALWQRKIGTPGGPLQFELRRLPIRRDLYTPEETAHWADQVNPFADARAMPAGTPDYFSTVGPVSHAIAIDIHDELKAAWSAIVDHPNHASRARMLELFDAMPDELTLKWPDKELAADWAKIMDSPDHPRRAEVVKILGDFAKRFGERYKDKPDTLLADRQRWTLFFRTNYREIVALAK